MLKKADLVKISTGVNVAFADESGTSGNEKCYSIGALLVPEADCDQLDTELKALAQKHGVVGEVKWTKVRSSHGLINFGIEVVKRVLSGHCWFSSIVVKKDAYRKWQINRENAFYTTYCQLMKHFTDKHGKPVRVLIDHRQDAYSKQDEAMEIITNRMLAQLCSSGKLLDVTKVDSKKLMCLQAADLLTGAINTAHHAYLNPTWKFAPGKALFISRMANVLGWDHLAYDTYPNGNFNVWQFPEETRAIPGSRNVKPNFSVKFVTQAELQQYIASAVE